MCAACNTRRMVEHVYPAVAVQQWVVVLPKRLRYFLHWDAGCPNRVVGIAMREVQRATARAYQHSCGSARATCATIHHEPLSMFGAIDEKIYTLVLTRIIKLEHMRRLP